MLRKFWPAIGPLIVCPIIQARIGSWRPRAKVKINSQLRRAVYGCVYVAIRRIKSRRNGARSSSRSSRLRNHVIDSRASSRFVEFVRRGGAGEAVSELAGFKAGALITFARSQLAVARRAEFGEALGLPTVQRLLVLLLVRFNP